MRTNFLTFLTKYRLFLKRLYYSWLILCFLFWICLAMAHFFQPIQGWIYEFLDWFFDSGFAIFFIVFTSFVVICFHPFNI